MFIWNGLMLVAQNLNNNMNLQENIQRIREVMGLDNDNPIIKGEYVYIGTCMNSFDEYGECLHDVFYDEEHFFNSWQNADEISKEEFWSNIDPSSEKYDELKELEADPEYPAEYRYNPVDDIYYIFVSEDTHYFFVKPNSHEINESQLKIIEERLEFGSKERIHVSTKPIDQMGVIQQSSGSLKPKGLWYGFGDQWINWLKSEMPEWWDEAQYAYKVFPNIPNLLVINTIDELDQFIDKYNAGRNIDWVRVAEEYDGIEFPSYSREGFRNLAFSSADHMKYMWVYSMDIASGCIWNPSGIKNIKAFGKKNNMKLIDTIFEAVSDLFSKEDRGIMSEKEWKELDEANSTETIKKKIKHVRGLSDECRAYAMENHSDWLHDVGSGKVSGLKIHPDLQKKIDEGNLPSGFSMGVDKKGYYIHTHRARSKSYENPAKIPTKDIKFVDSTG